VRINTKARTAFVTEVVEHSPVEIEALPLASPRRDVFIRRTGHKFWSEKDDAEEGIRSKGHRVMCFL